VVSGQSAGQARLLAFGGEDMTTAETVAPTTESIIRIDGSREGRSCISAPGLTLSVANTPLKAGGFGAAAFDGALQVAFAHDSRFSGLTIANVGGQGSRRRVAWG